MKLPPSLYIYYISNIYSNYIIYINGLVLSSKTQRFMLEGWKRRLDLTPHSGAGCARKRRNGAVYTHITPLRTGKTLHPSVINRSNLDSSRYSLLSRCQAYHEASDKLTKSQDLQSGAAAYGVAHTSRWHCSVFDTIHTIGENK
jgi:hypothetical protein